MATKKQNKPHVDLNALANQVAHTEPARVPSLNEFLACSISSFGGPEAFAKEVFLMYQGTTNQSLKVRILYTLLKLIESNTEMGDAEELSDMSTDNLKRMLKLHLTDLSDPADDAA